MSARFRAASLAAVLLVVAACNRGSDRPEGAEAAGTPLGATATGELPPGHPPMEGARAGSTLPTRARAALDSANLAYRDKQYDRALALYRTAATEAPRSSAPAFGIYMAAKAMGNTTLADSAMKAVQALGGDAQMTDSAMKDLHAKIPPKPITQ
jgi:hypothetical protein